MKPEIELDCPGQSQTLSNLLPKDLPSLFSRLVQDKHVSEVLEVLDTLQLRNTSTLHLHGEGRGGEGRGGEGRGGEGEGRGGEGRGEGEGGEGRGRRREGSKGTLVVLLADRVTSLPTEVSVCVTSRKAWNPKNHN